ncbi:MAG: AbrB family transcriptional regulator [Gammaproteobacteria bacterium]|nr:AbrB family transcriptional regulator [Gammaproteobacteria bacterium]MYJ75710.1 AbrB family transcriptional regulator [Gammaproteobacteria bacterium]
MPRVSSKRQITLPVDQCREVGIRPGDHFRSFVADGRITIVPMVCGSAKGCLRHLKGDPRLSDEESLRSVLDESGL